MLHLPQSDATALSIRIVYDSRKGAFMQSEMTEYRIYTLKDLRSIVCMAQGNTAEIDSHVLRFIEQNGHLKGETQVRVGEDSTEVVE